MIVKFKKLGDKWYPDIIHDYAEDLVIDPKLSRILTYLDKYKTGEIDVGFYEQSFVTIREGLIQFKDSDILRYFTTNDDFMMDVFIGRYKYQISSRLYHLLECNFKFDFHISIYRLVLNL